MSDDLEKNQGTSETPAADTTPAESTTPSVSAQETTASVQPERGSLLDKLLIPGAIILAGALIGGGIYLSGGKGVSGSAASADQPRTFEDLIINAAEAAEVDLDELAACRANDQYEDKIRAHFDQAAAAGAQGTPFFVVVNNETGDVLPFSGALPYGDMKEAVAQVRSGEISVAAGAVETAKAALPIADDDHVYGSREAAITMIEFSDFQCPYCARAHPTVTQIVAESDGEINWVYRHLPLGNHPAAYPASVASECARELNGDDAFWAFADALFAQQR